MQYKLKETVGMKKIILIAGLFVIGAPLHAGMPECLNSVCLGSTPDVPALLSKGYKVFDNTCTNIKTLVYSDSQMRVSILASTHGSKVQDGLEVYQIVRSLWVYPSKPGAVYDEKRELRNRMLSAVQRKYGQTRDSAAGDAITYEFDPYNKVSIFFPDRNYAEIREQISIGDRVKTIFPKYLDCLTETSPDSIKIPD